MTICRPINCRRHPESALGWGFLLHIHVYLKPVKFVSSMPQYHQIILIQPDAPPKPKPGAPCNGCGVCCLLEPCPLGAVLSGRRQGACVAVRWDGECQQYRCGALIEPAGVLKMALPRPFQSWAPRLAPGLARVAKRWIAVGIGCDSSVQPTMPDHPSRQ